MLKHPEILDFHIEDPRWRHEPHVCARLEEAAVATMNHLPKPLRFPCKVTLLLTKDATLKRLNHDFRGLDKPTNVLSFPQFHPHELEKIPKNGEPVHVGDIAIAYQYASAEALREHKELTNHAVHLLIHGILHLYGYDHQDDGEAVRMERLEKKIMAGMGLPDPYVSVKTGAEVQKNIRPARRKTKTAQ